MVDLSDIKFDQSEIDAIREKLALPEPPDGDGTLEQPAPRRRRGRPPGVKNKVTIEQEEPAILAPATLTKRNEREVAERLQNMLMGGTGILGMAKPYLPMTKDEAEAIAVPLASYLVRNADTIPIAHQILENYDLAAILLGTAAYTARVYNDRRDEVATERANNRTTLDRVRESQVTDNGRRSDEVASAGLSVAYYEGSQPVTDQL